jgi:hypothetical protein
MTIIFRQNYTIKEKNGIKIRRQRITDEKMLCIIFILVTGLFLAVGCESKEDKDIETEHQQIVMERINLLIEISHNCDTTDFREEPEFRFWGSLNKKQQSALRNFMFVFNGNVSKAARRSAISKMIKLLTPGIMINLAELTKKREQFFSSKYPIFIRKMNSYKEREIFYCNRLQMQLYYEGREESANWGQAATYYSEIKGKVFHKEFCFELGELLFDLHNAMLATESVAEPEE